MGQQDRQESTFSFIAGLMLGLLGGGMLGLLFAPKSGDELRSDINEFVKELPDKLNDEFRNPNTRTREFIAKTRYNIETQVGKVKRDMQADRMAKAKLAEEMASGYEY
jgi:gas vesicle protein